MEIAFKLHSRDDYNSEGSFHRIWVNNKANVKIKVQTAYFL